MSTEIPLPLDTVQAAITEFCERYYVTDINVVSEVGTIPYTDGDWLAYRPTDEVTMTVTLTAQRQAKP